MTLVGSGACAVAVHPVASRTVPMRMATWESNDRFIFFTPPRIPSPFGHAQDRRNQPDGGQSFTYRRLRMTDGGTPPSRRCCSPPFIIRCSTISYIVYIILVYDRDRRTRRSQCQEGNQIRVAVAEQPSSCPLTRLWTQISMAYVYDMQCVDDSTRQDLSSTASPIAYQIDLL